MKSETGNKHNLGSRLLAWFAHGVTASGAVWGLLSLLAIQRQDWKALFFWVALAMLADGLDGSLARRWRVKELVPHIDGGLLDNLVDYLNYVVVAAFFVINAPLLPPGWAFPAAALILLSSAYQFTQVDAKTTDHYFKGFPSYWNFLVIYLFVLQSKPWFNLALIVLCAGLVFVPIRYVYPSRTARHRRLNLIVAGLWGLSGLAGLILYPQVPPWLLGVNLTLVAVYLGISLWHTLQRQPLEGGPNRSDAAV